MLQKLTRREFMVLSGASMTALALNSCASTPPAATTAAPTTSSEPQRGGILRIGDVESLSNLDPWLTVGFSDIIFRAAIYEPLVQYSATFQLEPILATHWETSADGLTWIFHLRPDVTFHDGSPLTAEDVVHSFTQILKPDSGYTGGKILSFVEKVASSSPDTIEFTLNTVSVDFPIVLADPANSFNIVPRHKTVPELIDKPIGTGPFKVKEIALGTSTSFVRNENYWAKNLPYLDELRYLYMPEIATQVAALSSGELDMMWQINIETMAVLDKTPQIKVVEVPHAYYCPILLSVAQKPFDDVRVRQAMKHLVNREVFVKTVLQGRGEIANDQPIVPQMPFGANLPAYPFDIAKAKALLTEAGYPNGFETTLVTTDSFAYAAEGAVVFQEMAKQAGITINLKQIPVDTYWSEYLTYPMAMSSWPMPTSADQILSIAYHSEAFFNETGLQDKVLDGLIEAARSETNEAKRQELYTQAQQRIQTDGAVIIPYVSSIFYAHHEKVQGIIYPPNMIMRAHTAWLKQS